MSIPQDKHNVKIELYQLNSIEIHTGDFQKLSDLLDLLEAEQARTEERLAELESLWMEGEVDDESMQ